MSMAAADVVVIGAGPVGMASALMLAKRDLQVVLISPCRDRCKIAPHHPHSLLAPVVKVLDEHLPGVLSEVLARGGSLIDELDGVISEPMQGPRSRKLVKLASRRELLEDALWRATSANDGVDVAEEPAQMISSDGEGHAVRLVSGRSLRARIVIDASGAIGSRRVLSAARDAEPASYVNPICYFTLWLRGDHGIEHGQILHARQAKILMFRADGDYGAVGVAVHTGLAARRHLAARERLLKFIADARREPSPVNCGKASEQVLVAGGTTCAFRSTLGPYGNSLDGYFRTGDALLKTAPIHGRGLALGFTHAARLCGSIDHALSLPRAHAIALHKWERRTLWPWFLSQRADDARYVGDLAGRTEPPSATGFWERLQVAARSERWAATAIAEIKHLRRLPVEVSADPEILTRLG
jgi:2-polyprenyl-6-methoxyphenol hydroxylase-like FAD-dependent oxidoreductase